MNNTDTIVLLVENCEKIILEKLAPNGCIDRLKLRAKLLDVLTEQQRQIRINTLADRLHR